MSMDTNTEPSREGGRGDSSETILLSVLGDHPKTKMLALFIQNSNMDYNVTEIAEKSNLKRDTVYKYLDTLRAWGLVEKTRKVGNSQMFSLNNDSAAAESLAKFEWDLIEHLAEKEDAGELNDNNEPVI
jgi:DNA-binding transcriptional ArsR family regulator